MIIGIASYWFIDLLNNIKSCYFYRHSIMYVGLIYTIYRVVMFHRHCIKCIYYIGVIIQYTEL